MSAFGWAESHSKCFSMYSSKFWYIQVLSSISCAVLTIMITQHILMEQRNPAFLLVVPSWSVSSENNYAIIFSAISTPYWLQPGRVSRQHIIKRYDGSTKNVGVPQAIFPWVKDAGEMREWSCHLQNRHPFRRTKWVWLLQHGRMMNWWCLLGFLQPTGSFQKVSDHLFAFGRGRFT